MQGNMYSSFYQEEHENMAHQDTSHDSEEKTKEEDINEYCKQFADFMQAQLHQRYDLRYWGKRSREPKEQEGTSPQDIPLVTDKGKGKLNLDASKVKFCSNK